MTRLLTALVTSSLLLSPLPALSSPIPDVVLLEDGGMLRGAIVELVPGQRVVIALPTGETRTVEMAGVRYAGPTEGAPPVAPTAAVDMAEEPDAARAEAEPGISVHTGRAHLKLLSPDQTLTWHISQSSGVAKGPGGVAVARSFDQLCTAPCEVDLPLGTQQLALSRDGGIPLLADEAVHIDGRGSLIGRYEDKSSTRTAVILGSIAVSVGGLLLAISTDHDTIGLGLGLGGSLGFLLMPPDAVHVDYDAD